MEKRLPGIIATLVFYGFAITCSWSQANQDRNIIWGMTTTNHWRAGVEISKPPSPVKVDLCIQNVMSKAHGQFYCPRFGEFDQCVRWSLFQAGGRGPVSLKTGVKPYGSARTLQSAGKSSNKALSRKEAFPIYTEGAEPYGLFQTLYPLEYFDIREPGKYRLKIEVRLLYEDEKTLILNGHWFPAIITEFEIEPEMLQKSR